MGTPKQNLKQDGISTLVHIIFTKFNKTYPRAKMQRRFCRMIQQRAQIDTVLTWEHASPDWPQCGSAILCLTIPGKQKTFVWYHRFTLLVCIDWAQPYAWVRFMLESYYLWDRPTTITLANGEMSINVYVNSALPRGQFAHLAAAPAHVYTLLGNVVSRQNIVIATDNSGCFYSSSYSCFMVCLQAGNEMLFCTDFKGKSECQYHAGRTSQWSTVNRQFSRQGE